MVNRGTQAILAILLVAKDEGQKLTKTSLVKYLYMLDVYNARYNNGVTWTGWEWKFFHFGPWSAMAIESFDQLAENNFIEVDNLSSQDKEYFLYSLPSWRVPASLEDIGILNGVKVELIQIMKKYSNNLSALLNHVYFDTEPMENAIPNQILNFDECAKLEFSSIKPLIMKKLDKKAIESTRQKIQNAIQARKAKQQSKMAWSAPYDEVYFSGLSELSDSEPLPLGVRGSALINI